MDFEGKPICGGQMNSGPLDKEIYFLLWGERGGTAYQTEMRTDARLPMKASSTNVCGEQQELL